MGTLEMLEVLWGNVRYSGELGGTLGRLVAFLVGLGNSWEFGYMLGRWYSARLGVLWRG